jgi:hypothetical protein
MTANQTHGGDVWVDRLEVFKPWPDARNDASALRQIEEEHCP